MTLDALVAAGNPEPLLAWLEAQGPARRALAKQARGLFAEANRFDEARDADVAAAAWLAVFACDAPAAARWVALAPDDLPAIARRLRPAGLGEFVAKILPRFWHEAAELVEAGLAPRPPARLWALGLMGAPNRARHELFTRWADVVRRDVHLLFEHEGEGEFSLSAFTGPLWHDALVAWANDGSLDRGRVIDLALGALLSGFAAGRQGFFTGLLDALALDEAERAGRREPLARLLASSASPTVGWALRALAGALNELSAAELEPALRARSAETARAALAALARRREAEATRAVATALGHPSAEVQRAAAEHLLAACAPGELAALVDPWRSGLDPRVAKRLGEAQPAPATAPAAPARAVHPLDPDRALSPFEGDDHALLDAVAAWVADPTDVDRGEVLIAALAARTPGADAAAHARALVRGWDKRKRAGPGGLLARVARAWALGDAGEPLPAVIGWSSGRLYGARAAQLADALARGERVTWLSLPTHRGGHLAAPVALERWHARGPTVLEADRALAIARLSGPRPPGIEELAEGAAGPLAVIAAQAGLVGPHPACVRIGAFRSFDRTFDDGQVLRLRGIDGEHLSEPPWWGRRESVVAPEIAAARALAPGPSSSAPGPGATAHDRAATPDRPDEWYARAVHDLVRWYGSTEVDARRPDVVAVLHDDASPLGPLGHLVVAAAITSAHASVRIAGVDLVLAAIGDGRLDPPELGRQLAALLADDFLPAGRAVGALADVANAGFSAVTRDVWVAALPGLLAARDAGKVVDALDAALTAAPAPLPSAAREALASIRGGRAEKTARAILGR